MRGIYVKDENGDDGVEQSTALVAVEVVIRYLRMGQCSDCQKRRRFKHSRDFHGSIQDARKMVQGRVIMALRHTWK